MNEAEFVKHIKKNATEKMCNDKGNCLYGYKGMAYSIDKNNKLIGSYAYFTNDDVKKSIKLVKKDRKRRK